MIRAAYTKLTSRLWGTSLIYLLSRVVPAATGMLSVFLFIRILGEEAFGRYAVLSATALMAGNVASTWLVQSVLRFRSAYATDEAKWRFEEALRLGLVASVIVTAIALIPVFLIGLKTSWNGAIWAIAMALTLLHYTVAYAQAQSDMRLGRIVMAEVGRGVLGIVLPLVLLLLARMEGYIPILIGISLANVAGSLLLWSRGKKRTVSPDGVRAVVKQLWRYGGPFIYWVLITVLLNISDRYLIEGLLGSREVGVYSAMYDTAYKATNLLLMPIIMAVHPLVMNAWNAGERGSAGKLLRQANQLSLLLAAVLLGGWYFSSGWVARIALGYVSTEAQRLVVPIAVGAVAWHMAMISQKRLELQQRGIAMSVCASVALVAQVAANFFFLPRYGILTAAYTTVASALLYFVLVEAAARLHVAKPVADLNTVS